LRTWNILWNAGTGVTNLSQTVYSTGGNRYLTNTAPDSSYVLNAYSYGRLSSVTRYSSSSVQLGKTTYAYDPHGRVLTATDVRNGASTYGYNNADQVATVTTPAPGTGQSPQTATTYFDLMSRATNVVFADLTSVTNEYYLTGELKRTYGSRTYPVGYGYDTQGRMKTMTNWTAFPSTGARVTTWTYNAYRG
jgi:YD repeat-containing protein